MSPDGGFFVIVAKTLSAGGRSVGVPTLTAAEALLRFVRLGTIANDIGLMRDHLVAKSVSEVTLANAMARKAVAEAVSAENRNTYTRRAQLAEVRKAGAEADSAAAAARIDLARAKQIEAATQRLETELTQLTRQGGMLLADRSALEDLVRRLSAGDARQTAGRKDD